MMFARLVERVSRPEVRRFTPLFSVLAAAVLFMAVAFLNGRPTVFYDSESYNLSGRNFIDVVEHWPDAMRFHGHGLADIEASPVKTDTQMDPAMMGARSFTYGFALHALHRIGTIWLLAFLQCLAAAWVLYLLWRSAAPRAPRWGYLAFAAALTAGTSLSFYTTFAMPDVFAGIVAAGVVVMLVYPDRLKRPERIGLWLLLALGMAFHGSHVLTTGALTIVGAMLVRISGVDWYAAARRTLPLFAAAIAAFSVNLAYAKVFEARTGWELHRPPFLMARLLADGPGKRYLQHACAQGATYVACRFKDQPMADSNDVLWSNAKDTGVFNLADFKSRMRMQSEETRFAIGTVLYDPIGQAGASLKNWGEQLISFEVDDPLRDPGVFLSAPYWSTTSLKELVPNVKQCKPYGPGCKPPFNEGALAVWHWIVALGALGFLVWRVSRQDVRAAVRATPARPSDRETRAVLVAGALLLTAVIVNAAVCGVLSGPFPRYQARIAWLLPVAAGLVGFALAPQALRLRVPAWAAVLYERMATHPLAEKLNWRFLRFCAVGVLGFVVDWAVLEALVHGLGLNPVASRFGSFATAVLTTWLANRSFTFRAGGGENRLSEIGRYVAVQCTGGLANIAVYTLLLRTVPGLTAWLILPVAAGAAAGLLINYFGNKHLVFRTA
jgi:putative flippase GtrA